MVSHAMWKTWPSGLSYDKNLGLRPRFLSTESLGPYFSHGMGDHDQILQQTPYIPLTVFCCRHVRAVKCIVLYWTALSCRQWPVTWWYCRHCVLPDGNAITCFMSYRTRLSTERLVLRYNQYRVILDRVINGMPRTVMWWFVFIYWKRGSS